MGPCICTPSAQRDKEEEKGRSPELAGPCPSGLEESINSRFSKGHKSQKLKWRATEKNTNIKLFHMCRSAHARTQQTSYSGRPWKLVEQLRSCYYSCYWWCEWKEAGFIALPSPGKHEGLLCYWGPGLVPNGPSGGLRIQKGHLVDLTNNYLSWLLHFLASTNNLCQAVVAKYIG